MNARAPVSASIAAQGPGRAFSYGVLSGQLEVLKWIGLVFMLGAHTAEYLYGHKSGFWIEAGRLAFPLFALAFAVPLAHFSVPRGYIAAQSLLPYAIAAQILCQPLRDGIALNVLFQFLAVAAWCAADGETVYSRWMARALCLFAGFLAEFSLPGFFLLLGLVRWYESESWEWPWAPLVWLSALCYFEGSVTPLLALAVAAGVLAGQWGLPRIRRLFPVVYVGQFAVFVLVRGFQ